ncbi:magnesium transporter NIPA-domain-containing protein [Apiospora phragmitis]|uniref:Magnesium transporter NIPA-domain-containing protein n=1 Tax=Apiospora phragmitis TaxID=2905665 RepID=A0ABR1VYS8_9PEZI
MPVMPKSYDASWVLAGSGDNDDNHGSGPKIGNWSSLIGIITSIVGNILIALALNVQRYSHIKLQKRKTEARERAKEALRRAQNGGRNGYGAINDSIADADHDAGEEDDVLESRPLMHSNGSGDSGDSSWSGTSADEKQVASTYLKSPSWWLGQVLMTVGEMGNFLAYGFAPASIVSPLGVVALISNCVIAPLFFGEIFRARDFWGVVIAVGGAITVVLSAKQEETKLEPHDVWDAITTMEFEIYMGISIFLIVVLMWASPRYGNRSILIDLGLVGLFGGYTALTTKGVSSMLSSTLWRAFATPVTYGLLLVLLSTAVMQVRYVNKALQRFDSTQVIPIQFVLFTLSVIIGSAILYRDFERTTLQQGIKFIGGCFLTFFGVFLITSGRPRHDDEDELSDDENIEETIGLTEQDSSGDRTAKPSNHQPRSSVSSTASSRHSSRRASRISFAESGVNNPLNAVFHNTGVPSTRKPDGSVSRTSLPLESSPLLNNPWRNSVEDRPAHPGFMPTFSDDSVVTIHSATPANTDPSPTTGLGAAPPTTTYTTTNTQSERPTTPRPSFSSSRPHSHHFSNTIMSPSPLSSTITAVVADTLLRDNNTMPRRRSIRRLRPTIRSSLFVSQDGDDLEAQESGALRPTATEPQLLHRTAPTTPASGDVSDPMMGAEERQGLRGRARSVSNTLGDFFGRKSKRRNTNPETSSSSNSPSGERVSPSTTTSTDNSGPGAQQGGAA